MTVNLMVALQVFVGVLDHDDGRVHHGPDGDGDAAQGHDVGIDALVTHDDEGGQHPQRQADDGDQTRAQVKQEHQGHQGDHDELLDELVLEVRHRPQDERGAVVGGDDLHPLGETRLQLPELLLHCRDGGQRVLPVAHHDDAAGDLALAVQVRHHPAQLRTHLYARQVAQQHRGAGGGDVHGDGLDVRQGLDIAAAADHVLRLRQLHHRAAHLLVGVTDGRGQARQGDAVGAQLLGVGHHLVLAHHAAYRGHLRHAGDGLQL